MPTREEYAEQLLPLLAEGLGPQLRDLPLEEEFSMETLADILGGILEELETQHYSASEYIQALIESRPVEPWDGDGELAFLLYYLYNPPEEIRREVAASPPLQVIFAAMSAVAAQPQFTPNSFLSLTTALPQGNDVYCTKWGDVIGKNKYEMLDAGWLWTLVNVVKNHLPSLFGQEFGIADFVTRDWSSPVSLVPGNNDQVRIALIGDWGSGKYKLDSLQGNDGPACAVMETLRQLPTPPDYLIHLGDTYYSGTGSARSPRHEESENLVEILEQYPDIAKRGRCFTLNSNHEMYGGAYGFYQDALSSPLFSEQKGSSYFALEFGDWIIAGIDSAYFDPSTLYMEGGLGNKRKNPQYQFLEQIEKTGKKVILMSHHTGISTDGSEPGEYLWQDVTDVINPDYWYWGHIHLGVVYSPQAYSGNMKTRCIGHSSMPFAIPPGMQTTKAKVDWYSETPLDPNAAAQKITFSSPRAKNGFAVLTLSKNDIKEEVFDIGNTTPVWTS